MHFPFLFLLIPFIGLAHSNLLPPPSHVHSTETSPQKTITVHYPHPHFHPLATIQVLVNGVPIENVRVINGSVISFQVADDIWTGANGRMEVRVGNEKQQTLVKEAEKALKNGKKNAMELLEKAAEMGDAGAMASLGAMLLAGDNGVRRDMMKAIEYLKRGCEKGHADAQALMGFLYATGLARERGVEKSISKALLYWKFAAEGGSMFAEMAMGFRRLHGRDFWEDCEASTEMYERAAKEVVREFWGRMRRLEKEGIPPEIMPPQPKRIVGSVRKRLGMNMETQGIEDFLQMYQYTGGKTDPDVQVMVGVLHYHGSHGMERNRDKARLMFERAAKSGNAEAEAHLGVMDLMQGKHVEAFWWFKKSSEKGNLLGTHGLAYCLLHGLGTKQNSEEAVQLYGRCAKAENVEAIFDLGLLKQTGVGIAKNERDALELFRVAAESGHLLAGFFLGEALLYGTDVVEKDCFQAARYLKLVSEEGIWTSIFSKALSAYKRGNYESALYRYLQAAHAGIELAQYNAAYLYDKGLVGTTLMDREEQVRSSMDLYEMSASQGNPYSIVRVGDLAYTELKDYEAAANAYARGFRVRNAESTFNIGWMHWTGKGVKRDLHLAKRYFDEATHFSRNAKLPTYLATRALLLHGWFEKNIKGLRIGAYVLESVVVMVLAGLLAAVVAVRQRRLVHAE